MRALLGFFLIAVILAGSSTCGLGQGPGNSEAGRSAPRGKSLSAITSWGYQLQHAEPATVAASPYDLVVIDYSRTGQADGRFTPTDIRKMQRKTDGSRRLVLAYLSIGEAESYRFYWNEAWVEATQVVLGEDASQAAESAPGKPPAPESKLEASTLHFPKLTAPTWLGRENQNWPGNYHVRYWEQSWQDIIFGKGSSYLEQIIAAGFDGVYLDRVDAYYSVVDDRPESKNDMVRFVTALSRHAKSLKADFAIVPQNGEDLLEIDAYVEAIDGVAKEDLLYGYPTEGEPNADWVVENSITWLKGAQRRGVPVLVIEYTLDRPTVANLAARISGLGFIPYFGIRSLDRLVMPNEIGPASP